jgi:tRNA (guanine-N7-)-methyltransferase
LGKNKLKHFAEMLGFENVYQSNPGWKGKWRTACFQNDYPITLELACGKGEYTVGMAQRNEKGNFIGVDIKGARIYTGAKKALEIPLPNVRFIRTKVDHLHEYFAESEIDEIWITFADPHLPNSSAKRRLTSHKHIAVYKQILKPEGTINLKTDSDLLYSYTLKVIADMSLKVIYQNDDIYSTALYDERLNIKTYYENKHLAEGRTIKFIRFQL